MPDTITTAVPQQTPPANAIQHPAKVYLLSRRLPDIVHLVQYDQTLPVLAVELLQGDAPYTVPEGAAVNIRMAKPVPSNKKVYNPAYGISEDRHTVYIQVTPQMTVVAGCTNPVIEVVVDDGVACTGTLRLEIDPNPVQESDLVDTDEYLTIQEILAEAQAAAQIVQDNEQALQDVHNNLEAIQNAAANAQAAADSAQEAEDAADRAAIESQKALGFRSYFGGQVVPDTGGDLDPSRPMSTPTAASVTIKARGDRIAGLTMSGKTTQAGTGDPSPENIRMIDGIGMYDKMLVLDGSSDEAWQRDANGVFVLRNIQGETLDYVSQQSNAAICYARSNNFKASSVSETYMTPTIGTFTLAVASNQYGRLFVYTGGGALENFKSYLSAHPLTVWYKSVNYAKSTGPFYTVVELSDDPYRAVGFELNQPLFDGDSLKVGGKSGFDRMVVLDGSESLSKIVPSDPNRWDYQVVGVGRDAVSVMSDYLPGYTNRSGIQLKTTPGICVPDLDVDFFVINMGPFLSENSAAACKSYLSAHPLTVFYRSTEYTEENDIPVALESHTYELATPVSYARPIPTMIAQPGEDGTFTVTGENSLSVLLKPFQDGGDAATIEGHTWADIQKLISDAVTSAIALSK